MPCRRWSSVPEHYYTAYHHLFTSAAPIHDVRGRIVGAIGIAGPLEAANAHTLALVMSAARAISTQIQADWSLQEANHRLSEVNTIMSTITEGVIAWDINGEIIHVNKQAGKILGLNPAATPGPSHRRSAADCRK